MKTVIYKARYLEKRPKPDKEREMSKPYFLFTSTSRVVPPKPKPKKKVYCKKCKFYRPDVSAEQFFPLAKGVEGVTIDCVVPKMDGYANSRYKNENNDCDWYERKWFWK